MNKLFHGSSVSGIKTFKPAEHKAVDGKSVVFATDDKAYALAMIHGTGDELAVSYAVNPDTGEREMYVDELEKEKLSLLDQEGYLYEVNAQDFEESPEGLEGEYVSYGEVSVQSEVKVQNLRDELQKLGVNLIRYEDVPDSMSKRKQDPSQPQITHKEDRFV